ncbi:hypothetical protein BGZ99_004544 [Dissophora globulifera]|uniref:STEEP1 domain-containing protein n=1 Tax=Dissophora globulifera TaxID=979702 RepID=A0A9P6RLT5_9FUNG|nr:hypothetical protein BGZ99_004544 [Dissophora globulifera]
MPKIISNSIISSSDNREEAQGLHSYYCLCSEFILVIDIELGQLPQRETDNATIIENATRMYKLHATPGETTPHLKGGAYTYIVQGALSEIQGVPHEDWNLDLPGGEARRQDTLAEAQDQREDHEVGGDGNDSDTEMKVRMEGNQDAAAKARAMLAAAATGS